MGMLDPDDDRIYRLKGQTFSINVITAVTEWQRNCVMVADMAQEILLSALVI